MTKKKEKARPAMTPEDQAQAQRVLGQYRQIAGKLQTSASRQQAEAALQEINVLPEGVQMSLLKQLSQERHVQAANLLVALNELSPLKNVRKEAKRVLIQLEGTKIYPDWRPPVEQPLPLALAEQPDTLSMDRRFWKGLVTDSRNIGEVQLILCWEQGTGYRDVLVMGFLLEFWHDGVKDFYTRVERKQRFEEFAAHMTASYGVPVKDCSLAEGRQMLREALAVNTRTGTTPHRDYRRNLPLVNQLVLEAPGLEDEELDFDEDDDEDFDETLQNLEPAAVVTTFVEGLYEGDFDTAYTLLARESPLREGLSLDEWVARYDSWFEESEPEDLEPEFVHEIEAPRQKLWLPFGGGKSSGNTKQIEAAWSVVIDETPLDSTLPVLPRPTITNEDTDRSWFWASYTLAQEDGEWRIQSMTDEGTDAASLPTEEQEQRIAEHERYLSDHLQKYQGKTLDIEEAEEVLQRILWRMVQLIYYCDARIKQSPDVLSSYENAASRSLSLQFYERCAVYVELMTKRFTENRAMNLRALAELRQKLSEKYADKEDDTLVERFLELAESDLNESLELEDNLHAHISLAELNFDDERLDEAEQHLLHAKAMNPDVVEEADIELHLGEIETGRERYEEALAHYQRVTELQPGEANAWASLAKGYRDLDNFEEAEKHYRHAIELAPENDEHYVAFSDMYKEADQPDKAIEVLEEGVSAHPDSADLLVTLATTYLEQEDYEQADIFLEKAERVNPDLEIIPILRQMLALSRTKPATPSGKLRRSRKKKRK